MQNLQELGLEGNQLTSLPTEIGKLQNLQELGLEGNPILRKEKTKINKLLAECFITF